MEVRTLGTHPAGVQRHVRADHVRGGLDVVAHHHRHGGQHLEAGGRRALLAAGGEPLGEQLAERGVGARGVEAGQPAVGDLGGERHVPRALGRQHDRDLPAAGVHRGPEGLAQPRRAGGVRGQRQPVEGAVVGHGALAGHHLAHDVDELPRAGQGTAVRLAVPALDHLRARGAEAQHEPPAGQVVERDRVHRGGRGRARGHLRDAGAQAHPPGARAPPGQRRERVGAVGLGGPDGVEAEGLGRHEGGHDARRGPAGPVAGLDADAHGRLLVESGCPGRAVPGNAGHTLARPGLDTARAIVQTSLQRKPLCAIAHCRRRPATGDPQRRPRGPP